MAPIKRKFISLYFNDMPLDRRKKKYLTIAFDTNSALYEKCNALSATKIKELVGATSYVVLVEKANNENRSLSNYIKNKLSLKLL